MSGYLDYIDACLMKFLDTGVDANMRRSVYCC
jgi:hypothetical protein